jgi:tetratricopeptide (TPR) repeat protein
MAIEGALSELSIQDVLQLLELAHKTGVLTVTSDRLNDETIIHLTRGAIVFAVRRRSTRRLGQLLMRAGKLTQRELDGALAMQRLDPTRRLAEILLEMGSVEEEELERQLRFQMEETIYEIMPWNDGHFRFEERTELAAQRLLARVRVESLLMEGARRIDEWTRLENKVPGPETVPLLAPINERELTPVELRAQEWEVLAEIDGERDIRQIAANLGRSAFDIAKTVYGMVSLGLLDVVEPQSRVPEHQLDAACAEVDNLLRSGRTEDAQKLAAQLEASYPERAELALLSGRTFVAQHRMRAATESFSRAAGLDPASAEAQYLLGFAAIRTGELERASRAWETFLRLSPGGEARQLAGQALASLRSLMQIVTKATKN